MHFCELWSFENCYKPQMSMTFEWIQIKFSWYYPYLHSIENYISIFWFWRWTLLWREQTWFFNYINSTDKVQYNKIGIVLAFFPHKDIVFIFCHISTSICSDHICYHFWLYYCLHVIIYKHLKISKKVKYSYILGI